MTPLQQISISQAKIAEVSVPTQFNKNRILILFHQKPLFPLEHFRKHFHGQTKDSGECESSKGSIVIGTS